MQLRAEKIFGESNGQYEITVLLSNPKDKVAFFVEPGGRDEKSGEAVTPVFWSDNHVSLLPGETKP